MLKPYKDPYGYRKLLAYQKAEELQLRCNQLTHLFPKTKTLYDLADQMDRSARSGKQNIVEGWRRNTTKEYYDFLGFCIGAIAELEEDCNDIWRGVYRDLTEIKGIMGEIGLKGSAEMGEREIKGAAEMEERGTRETADMGEMGNSMNCKIALTVSDNPLNQKIASTVSDNPLTPLNPFPPFDIEKLKFYPLDENLPPVVKLKLRCKELNFMLHRIQESLLIKMDQERFLNSVQHEI